MSLPSDQRVGTPRCGVPRPRAARGTGPPASRSCPAKAPLKAAPTAQRAAPMSLRACFENGWRGRVARPGRRPAGTCLALYRSAELNSAVSQSCTLRGVAKGRRVGPSDALPNIIRRYSRLKICATAASPQQAKQIHPSTGTSAATLRKGHAHRSNCRSRSVRQVAGRHRPVAGQWPVLPRTEFFKHALNTYGLESPVNWSRRVGRKPALLSGLYWL